MGVKVLKYGLFLGIILIVGATGIISVLADFSDYTLADPNDYSVDFEIRNFKSIAGGTAYRILEEWTITNEAQFPYMEAILVLKITFVTYDGTYTTDPSIIATLMHVENSGETWQGGQLDGGYVVHLGTIQPSHSKKQCVNLWAASNVNGYYIAWQVWYLD